MSIQKNLYQHMLSLNWHRFWIYNCLSTLQRYKAWISKPTSIPKKPYVNIDFLGIDVGWVLVFLFSIVYRNWIGTRHGYESLCPFPKNLH
jgi:hypothetical protein